MPSHFTIQLTNSSGSSSAYFLSLATPAITSSNGSHAALATVFQKSPPIHHGHMTEFRAPAAVAGASGDGGGSMAAICGTSPGAPLGPGVEVVFSDSVAVRGANETVDLGVVSVSDEQAVFVDTEGDANSKPQTPAPQRGGWLTVQADGFHYEAALHPFIGVAMPASNGALTPIWLWEFHPRTVYTVAPPPLSFVIGTGTYTPGTVVHDLAPADKGLAFVEFEPGGSSFCRVVHQPNGEFTVGGAD